MSPPNLNLLYVEDDEVIAAMFQLQLKQELGQQYCTITHVDSLGKALKAMKAIAFSAILLDLDLKDVQGQDSVRAIKEENPEIPIVVLSGHDNTEIALKAIRNGAQEYLVKGHCNSRMLGLAVLSSIERKAYERQLFNQANYDELTGLPNRRMFMDYMERWLARSSRWKRAEALFFLDVNGFKYVNDTFGHDVGDQLLQQVAQRLKNGLRTSDMLARFAGDEFVIHLDGNAHISQENCTVVAEKISSLFTPPIVIEGRSLQVGLSIGIAIYPEHGSDVEALIQRADQAMYKAKQAKMGFAFA